MLESSGVPLHAARTLSASEPFEQFLAKPADLLRSFLLITLHEFIRASELPRRLQHGAGLHTHACMQSRHRAGSWSRPRHHTLKPWLQSDQPPPHQALNISLERQRGLGLRGHDLACTGGSLRLSGARHAVRTHVQPSAQELQICLDGLPQVHSFYPKSPRGLQRASWSRGGGAVCGRHVRGDCKPAGRAAAWPVQQWAPAVRGSAFAGPQAQCIAVCRCGEPGTCQVCTRQPA